MHNVEMWWGLGLGRAGVEDVEDRVADGGREGGENGDKSAVGWIREGKVEPRVSDGVVGSF